MNELDVLQWAVPILERDTKESFDAQLKIDQENAERRAGESPANPAT
jgi:hypothetical protein